MSLAKPPQPSMAHKVGQRSDGQPGSTMVPKAVPAQHHLPNPPGGPMKATNGGGASGGRGGAKGGGSAY